MTHRAFLSFATGVIALGIGLATVNAKADQAGDADLITKGKYLATAGDCVACHTIPGGKPFAGNRAMETPFGTIFTANITPDKATGIGAWSDDDFYRALHEGIGHRGEYLYPVFPFPWYTNVTRDDVLAIKAYLFSLEPVNSPRSPLKFRFPFNIRAALLTWRTAFFKPGTFKPDPAKSEEVNRGAYLVEGLGHCGECHNHNSALGASDWSGKLKGGEIQGWYAPNITSDGKEGVGSWRPEEIVTFLRSGAAPGRGVVLGPMHETIDSSLQYLTEPDLKAIAAYLKSFSGTEAYKPLDTNQVETASAGVGAYLTNCASCHGVNGHGIKGVVPALANNGAVKAGGPQDVIKVVLGGLPASNGYAPMPAVGANLPDQDVAAIANYVRTAWGNAAPANAETGLVSKLRATSMTLMSATTASGCVPPDGTTAVSKAIRDLHVVEDLKGATMQDLLQRIDTILPKIEASAPEASSDQIINTMIEAYCPVALADESVPPAQRTALLGSFGGLVYGQLHHIESGAADTISAPAKQQ